VSLRWRIGAAVVAGVVLLGSIVYLLVLAAGGDTFLDTGQVLHGGVAAVHHPAGWLVAAIVAAIAALTGWALAERRAATAQEAADAVQQAREDARSAAKERDDAVRERERLSTRLSEQRGERERVVRAWQAERQFNRDLRGQIERMQRAHGVLGRHDDVRALVLELTMSLVEAEKGILLSANERGGKLEVVCFSGFDNDPSDSALAQRFAGEVIERDTTIREDDQGRVASEGRGPADEEVHNLLAIPMYLLDDFSGVIVCANREDGFDHLEDDVLVAVGDHAGAVLQNSRLHGDLRTAYLSTIRVLADAIELKDPELRGHVDAVSDYVLAVADRLELAPERREALTFGALLHDVGKLGISERILLKPAALTDEERSVIELHPRIGYQLVRNVPALADIAPAVLHHHERFDGTGYPGRLRGEAIPLEARIIAVADTFSAITSERPYSPARPVADACVELERCAGGQFDPQVVSLFVEEVRRRPPEESADEPATPAEPEIELHREPGEFKLGSRAFGITDSLTMLYSHRHLHETARAEAQRAELQSHPFAVIVAQLLNLAEINRSRGFAFGDATLQMAAGRVQLTAGRCRGLAFRASGRRLALLAPGANDAAAEQLATELLDQLQESSNGDGCRYGVGAAAWRPGDDGEHVISRASAAAADGDGPDGGPAELSTPTE
jgi:diguanylate cyclase (GGDEF)-like protein